MRKLRLVLCILFILLLICTLSGCSKAGDTLVLTQEEYSTYFSSLPDGPDGYYFRRITYASDPPYTTYGGGPIDLTDPKNASIAESLKQELVKAQIELYGEDFFPDPNAPAEELVQFEPITVKVK